MAMRTDSPITRLRGGAQRKNITKKVCKAIACKGALNANPDLFEERRKRTSVESATAGVAICSMPPIASDICKLCSFIPQ